VALAGGLAAGYRLGKKVGYIPPPNYQQLTFRRGEVYSARFAPDGQSVVYASAWDGKPVELFSTRTAWSHVRPRRADLPRFRDGKWRRSTVQRRARSPGHARRVGVSDVVPARSTDAVGRLGRAARPGLVRT
jgi:hypothetical protein